MNKQEIMGILPHRDSMLLVDSAEVVDAVAHGKYQIKGTEWFLDGHFPGNSIVPGVILCEMMAQASCVLLAGQIEGEVLTFLTGLDKVKFKHPVLPGDVFESACEIVKNKGPFYFAKGNGYVNGKLAVSAEFSFAVKGK